MENSLAARIREARIKANLSQNQLAKMTGIAQSALHSLESGRTKMSTRLRELARSLNVSVEWLLGVENSRNGLEEPSGENWWTDNQPPPTPFIPGKFAQEEIPILATTATDDGAYMTIGSQIATTFRHPVQLGVRGACALHVIGDAMYPRYNDGELIYCLKTITPTTNQDMVIILNDGRAMIRRLIKLNYTARKLSYTQFNPPQEGETGLDDIKEIWPIVGRR